MQVLSSGTQTATVGTTHTLYSDIGTGNNIYVVMIDTGNLDYGDSVEIEILTRVLSTGVTRIILVGSYTGRQIEPIKLTPPIPSDQGIEVRLTQSEGTGRSFDWKVIGLL